MKYLTQYINIHCLRLSENASFGQTKIFISIKRVCHPYSWWGIRQGSLITSLSITSRWGDWWDSDLLLKLYALNCFVKAHYNDVIMAAKASQITSLTIVYSTVYFGADQRKHQSSASLAFVRAIHRWPVNSSHKWPVTRKMLPFDDVIMSYRSWNGLGTGKSGLVRQTHKYLFYASISHGFLFFFISHCHTHRVLCQIFPRGYCLIACPTLSVNVDQIPAITEQRLYIEGLHITKTAHNSTC